MERLHFQLAAGNGQLAAKRYSVNRVIAASRELRAVCCQLQAGAWISPWAVLELAAFLFLGRIVHRAH